MPMPATSSWYRSQVFRALASGRRSSDVVADVPRIAADAGRTDVPGARTIQRMIHDFRELASEEQSGYAPVSWPDSFEAGLVPWESARDVLDLVRHCAQTGLPSPTVSEARWWWRLRLASPSVPMEWGSTIARSLAELEVDRAKGTKDVRIEVTGLSSVLAYEPWRGSERQAQYSALIEREGATATPRFTYSLREDSNG
jgi:hypothetical protein